MCPTAAVSAHSCYVAAQSAPCAVVALTLVVVAMVGTGSLASWHTLSLTPHRMMPICCSGKVLAGCYGSQDLGSTDYRSHGSKDCGCQYNACNSVMVSLCHSLCHCVTHSVTVSITVSLCH